MVTRWVPNSDGELALMNELAAGANNFAEHVRTRVKEIEKGLERYHFSSRTVPSDTRYPNTINQATYLNGELVGGKEVRGVGNVVRTPLRSVVYSTSFLAHMLEITGAQPHDIPVPLALAGTQMVVLNVKHPGFNRRPHFVPGLFSAVDQVGAKMRGKVKTGALRPPPTRPPVGG